MSDTLFFRSSPISPERRGLTQRDERNGWRPPDDDDSWTFVLGLIFIVAWIPVCVCLVGKWLSSM